MRILLALMSLLVPRRERPRWREEWRAELQHGPWRMILGALPDAWAMRKLTGVPAEAGSYRRHPFHALDQDVRYAARTLFTAPLFSASVIGSLTAGIAVTATAFMFLNASLFRPFPGIGDPAVLGRHVGLGSSAATIVGVAPPDFAGATASERGARGHAAIEIWAPIELADQLAPPLTRTPAGPAVASVAEPGSMAARRQHRAAKCWRR